MEKNADKFYNLNNTSGYRFNEKEEWDDYGLFDYEVNSWLEDRGMEDDDESFGSLF